MGDVLEVADGGSKNGTFVRGKAVPESGATIAHGESVMIGAYTLTLRVLTEETQLPLTLEGPRLVAYETLARIGKGAYSQVFSAIHRETGKLVAVKVLKAGDDDEWLRFDREARLMSNLDSKNLVNVLEYLESGSIAHIVMEFVDGQTIRQACRGEGLPIEEVAKIGHGLAAGLADLHEAGVIHRDVKPSNVLLPYSGGVKLTDLGIAKEVGDASLTQAGQGLGTFGYMAPEQALDARGADARCDLYGLGATLYHLLLGRAPLRFKPIHSQQDLRDAIQILRTRAPVPPTVHRPETPEWLEKLVMKLLSKDPTARGDSAADAADLLGKWAALLKTRDADSLSETSAEMPKPPSP